MPLKRVFCSVAVRSRSQASRFEGNKFLGGKIFVFIICVKLIFLGTKKFVRAQKIGGALRTNRSSCYQSKRFGCCIHVSARGLDILKIYI